MGIIGIIKKECTQNIRDLNVMMIMTMFPIILIFLVGSAFGSLEGDDIYGLHSSKVDILINEVSPKTTETVNRIQGVLSDHISIENQVRIVREKEQSLLDLMDNQVDMIVEVGEEEIRLYKNDTYDQQFTILKTLLFGINSENTDDASIDSALVVIEKVENSHHQSLLDYYGVAFLVLFVVYGISNSITYTIKEMKSGNISRILQSPVKAREIIIGKVLGHSLINAVQVGIVFVTTILIFDVNWGDKPLMIILLLLSSVVMVVSLGTLIGIALKSEAVALSVIHTLIVAFAFFGGSYMSLKGMGYIGEVGKFFSPIWWITNGIINYIYDNNADTLLIAMTINIVCSLIFSWSAWIVLRKKEVLL